MKVYKKDIYAEIQELVKEYYQKHGRKPDVIEMTTEEFEELKLDALPFVPIGEHSAYLKNGFTSHKLMGMRIRIVED